MLVKNFTNGFIYLIFYYNIYFILCQYKKRSFFNFFFSPRKAFSSYVYEKINILLTFLSQ